MESNSHRSALTVYDFPECDDRQDGRCTRFDIRARPAWCQLCQTRPDYVELWERGCGPGQPPCLKGPTLVRKAVNYAGAVARHIASGWKKRSQQDINQIYTELCEPCEFRNKKTGGCRVCGCCVNRSRAALRNKIAMASEHCPKQKW